MTADELALAAVHAGALQKVTELARLVEIVDEHRPGIIVEIGSDAGGTLAAWTQLAPVVISVDLPSGPFSTRRPLEGHGAKLIAGDSHDPDVWMQLYRLVGRGGIDFLFVDGDHTYTGVRADAVRYEMLVRRGGLVAFHDVCPHPDHPDVGVPQLWAEIKAGQLPGFVPVEEITACPLTWGGIGLARV